MQKSKTPIAPSLSPDAPLPKAWPFEEARKITARLDARASDAAGEASEQAPALLETGYGPSGLPHIGTFGEVARTTWAVSPMRH